MARYRYRYQGFSYKENCVLEALGLVAEVSRTKSRKDPEERLCVGYHASHITVILSKAAHSGPSVCLRARAPCPLRVSCPGADRAESAQLSHSLPWSRSSDRVERAAQLQALAFRCCPWVKTEGCGERGAPNSLSTEEFSMAWRRRRRRRRRPWRQKRKQEAEGFIYAIADLIYAIPNFLEN